MCNRLLEPLGNSTIAPKSIILTTLTVCTDPSCTHHHNVNPNLQCSYLTIAAHYMPIDDPASTTAVQSLDNYLTQFLRRRLFLPYISSTRTGHDEKHPAIPFWFPKLSCCPGWHHQVANQSNANSIFLVKHNTPYQQGRPIAL